MPLNEVRGIRSLETIEAHIEILKKQLDKAETRKAEAVERVALADRVIDDLKVEIDKYEAEADEKAVDIGKRFEKADAYAEKIIRLDSYRKPKPEIESQSAASHRYWHASGRSTPKGTCSFCVAEGLTDV